MSYAVTKRGLQGIEDYDPLFGGCHYDEVMDADTGECVEHFCPGDEAPYYGTCMPLDTQRALAELRCDASQQWPGPGHASCRCKPGYVPSTAGQSTACMPAPVPVAVPEGSPAATDTERPWTPSPGPSAAEQAGVSMPPWWMFAGGGALLMLAALYYRSE